MSLHSKQRSATGIENEGSLRGKRRIRRQFIHLMLTKLSLRVVIDGCLESWTRAFTSSIVTRFRIVVTAKLWNRCILHDGSSRANIIETVEAEIFLFFGLYFTVLGRLETILA